MGLFEEIANRNIKCELCGAETVALYGGGWDNDRIYCTDKDCGAEMSFRQQQLSRGSDGS